MIQKSIKVRDFMARELVTLAPDMEVLRAVHMLLDNDIAGAPVIDQLGELVGILTEKDCMQIVLQAGYHSEPGGLVSDFMSTDVVSIDAELGIVDAAKLFFGKQFHRYPVFEDDRLVGQISRRDVLRALVAEW